MITAVDTNVLVDILEPDPRHGVASADALTRCLAEGTVVACDIVWAEVATVYGDQQGPSSWPRCRRYVSATPK